MFRRFLHATLAAFTLTGAVAFTKLASADAEAPCPPPESTEVSSLVRLPPAPTTAPGICAAVMIDTGAATAHSDDDIVVQFTTGGGFTGPCCTFWDLPEITVYADGTAVTTGYRDGQIPEMTVAALDWSDIEEVLADASDAGLLGAAAPDAGALCCDLAYTSVVLHDGVATNDFQVMGLGFEGQVTNSGLTAEQLQVRTALVSMQNRIRELIAKDDDAAAYAPEELALLVFPGRSQPDDELQPWPLDQPLSDAGHPDGDSGRCVHVTGSDASAVLDAASAAESASWTSAGEEWTVVARPLLPHEHGCPDNEERSAQCAELADQRATWAAAGTSDYSFVITAHCFCPTEYTTPRTVTVTDGSITEVDPELPAGLTMPLTVDELFALVAQGLDDAALVDIGYDDEFGFPTAIFIDWDTQITDEESAYEITDFESLG